MPKRYETTGSASFTIEGVLQYAVHNNKMKCYYYRFCINGSDKQYYSVISVTVPDQIVAGYHHAEGLRLLISGHFRSWQKSDRVSLELVADSIEILGEGAEEDEI